jgi:hypothetical protein|tara:strand:+ start:291 stop:788 length:498 start_codon:yes stop_codon:yes gene_type:complete
MDDLHSSYLEETHIPSSFNILDAEKMSPTVWGPHYWFFLHTIAQTYPLLPNSTTKRKYYDFIQNLPLFIPNMKIGNHFSKLLDNYPITPYLDNRDSFIRWVHFIHNRVNRFLDVEECTLFEALDNYHSLYKPKAIKVSERFNIKKEYIIAAFTISCFILIYVYYQ